MTVTEVKELLEVFIKENAEEEAKYEEKGLKAMESYCRGKKQAYLRALDLVDHLERSE